MTISRRELKRMYEGLGANETSRRIGAALREGELKPNDFSIRDVAEATVPYGAEWVRDMDPNARTSGYLSESAADAVNTSAFSDITGQIVYTKMLEGYQDPAFIGDSLVETIPTKLSGEKIPGVSRLGDEAQIVEEGQPYPKSGLTQDYIETPETKKRGDIVPVTKEAIFFDRTNLILHNASEVGYYLGLNREKRILDVVIGATNSFKWKGSTYNTYQASTPWVNKHTNALADYTDIDNALVKFSELTDPATGEPMFVMPKQILVEPGLAATANSILHATQVRIGPAAAEGDVQQVGPSPLRTDFEVLSSPVLKARMTAGTVTANTWWVGDFRRAFAYMENWPVTVTQAPSNHPDEFDRDIVTQYKASERGVAAVLNPRYAQQNDPS